MLTLLELSDVTSRPKVKMDLAGPLQLGSRVRLGFCLSRLHYGRTEILEVLGEFRVAAVGLDAVQGVQRQVLSVDSVGTSPVWRAVKKRPEWKRVLPPAKAPRTVLE